jgi:hypothetical protein
MLAGALRLGVGDERVAGSRDGLVRVTGACPAAGSTTCGLDRGIVAETDFEAVVVVSVVPEWPADPFVPQPASAMTAVSVARGARIGRL